MIRPGGSEGGVGKFVVGLVLSAVSLYFFFDSVRVSTDGAGLFSGGLRGMRGGGGWGMWDTTSMGIVFFPFLIGVIALFYDARKKWAWVVTWIGLGVIVIEILSRIRFVMNTKTSLLLLMFVGFAAGAGLMLQSYRDGQPARKREGDDERELGAGRGPGSGDGLAGPAEKARDEVPD